MTELKNTRLALAVLLANTVEAFKDTGDTRLLQAAELLSETEEKIWHIEQGRLVA